MKGRKQEQPDSELPDAQNPNGSFANSSGWDGAFFPEFSIESHVKGIVQIHSAQVEKGGPDENGSQFAPGTASAQEEGDEAVRPDGREIRSAPQNEQGSSEGHSTGFCCGHQVR